MHARLAGTQFVWAEIRLMPDEIKVALGLVGGDTGDVGGGD